MAGRGRKANQSRIREIPGIELPSMRAARAADADGAVIVPNGLRRRHSTSPVRRPAASRVLQTPTRPPHGYSNAAKLAFIIAGVAVILGGYSVPVVMVQTGMCSASDLVLPGNSTGNSTGNGTIPVVPVPPLPTITSSPSFSPSPSPTASASVTVSMTPTPTPSRSGTPAATSTRSRSATATASQTASATSSKSTGASSSSSSSASISATATASFTVSTSPTSIPTPTESATETVDPSASQSPTSSLTASPTPTPTPTATVTVTSTTTVSGSTTMTATITTSGTPSSTQTITMTQTGTGSWTASVTPSPSLTASGAASLTSSQTPTPSLTITATPTGTPTSSLTVSVSATPTSSATVTPNPTSTSTSTPAGASASSTPNALCTGSVALAVPNAGGYLTGFTGTGLNAGVRFSQIDITLNGTPPDVGSFSRVGTSNVYRYSGSAMTLATVQSLISGFGVDSSVTNIQVSLTGSVSGQSCVYTSNILASGRRLALATDNAVAKALWSAVADDFKDLIEKACPHFFYDQNESCNALREMGVLKRASVKHKDVHAQKRLVATGKAAPTRADRDRVFAERRALIERDDQLEQVTKKFITQAVAEKLAAGEAKPSKAEIESMHVQAKAFFASVANVMESTGANFESVVERVSKNVTAQAGTMPFLAATAAPNGAEPEAAGARV